VGEETAGERGAAGAPGAADVPLVAPVEMPAGFAPRGGHPGLAQAGESNIERAKKEARRSMFIRFRR